MALTQVPIELSSTPGIVDNSNATAITIDSSENVGIGTSPTSPLHIKSATDVNVRFDDSGSSSYTWYMNDAQNLYIPNVQLASTHTFYANGQRKVDIDASGNLLVGTTDNNPVNNSANTSADNGVALGGLGVAVARYNNTPMFANRTGTDGTIFDFRKSGSTVGSIGTVAGRLGIGTGDSGLFFDDDNNRIGPVTLATGTPVDSNGLLDLGYSGARFKDLYLSGGAYLGGTGSANLLDDYEEGTWTPSLRRNDGTVAATHSTVGATYVKIGRTVIVKAWIYAINATGTDGSSYWRVLGLPFSSTSYGAMRLAYNDTGADSIYSSAAVGILASGVSAYTGSLSGGFMIDFAYETNE